MSTEDRQPRQTVVTFGSVFGAFKRQGLLLIAFVVIGVLVGAGGSLLMKRTYDSEAIVDITPSVGSGLDPKSVSTATEERIAASHEVAAAAAKQLGVSADEVSGSVTVSSPLNSLLITITYSAPSAAKAADGANAVAAAYVAYRQNTIAAQNAQRAKLYQAQLTPLDSQLRELRVQLSQLSPSQRSAPNGELLQAQISQLQNDSTQLRQGLDGLQTSVVSAARTVGQAVKPTASSQRRSVWLAGGLVLGLLLGALCALLRERRDDRIRDVGELADVAGAPVLAESNRVRGDVFVMDGRQRRDGAADYYRVIAVKLRSDSDVRTVVVASPDGAHGDLVAANLAAALSELGLRTALVADEAGLAPLAARGQRPDGESEATDVHLVAIDGTDVSLPDVYDRVAALQERFEVVVIDGEGPKQLSLTLGLARLADAALLVVRRGRTTRRAVRHLVTDLDHVDVFVEGVALMKAERGRPPKQQRQKKPSMPSESPRTSVTDRQAGAPQVGDDAHAEVDIAKSRGR